MSSRQSQLQEDTEFRVMRMLQADPDLTQRDMAERVGISVGGLNYCLKALIGKGWIKVQNFSSSRNKFGYAYLLTPAGVAQKASLTGRFLKRKLGEYEALEAEIAALQREAADAPQPDPLPDGGVIDDQTRIVHEPH